MPSPLTTLPSIPQILVSPPRPISHQRLSPSPQRHPPPPPSTPSTSSLTTTTSPPHSPPPPPPPFSPVTKITSPSPPPPAPPPSRIATPTSLSSSHSLTHTPMPETDSRESYSPAATPLTPTETRKPIASRCINDILSPPHAATPAILLSIACESLLEINKQIAVVEKEFEQAERGYAEAVRACEGGGSEVVGRAQRQVEEVRGVVERWRGEGEGVSRDIAYLEGLIREQGEEMEGVLEGEGDIEPMTADGEGAYESIDRGMVGLAL
ncbi:hypothetical protein ACLMJK_006375 [Lecanora helva]